MFLPRYFAYNGGVLGTPNNLENLRVVLVRSRNPLNIGAAARHRAGDQLDCLLPEEGSATISGVKSHENTYVEQLRRPVDVDLEDARQGPGVLADRVGVQSTIVHCSGIMPAKTFCQRFASVSL